MEVVKIEGPSKLEGSVKVQGSKNAALPMLAACVITGSKTVLENCPKISDINISISILRNLGCTVQRRANKLIVNSEGISSYRIPEEKMKCLRSSFLFSGALLARFGKVSCTYPGGCNIGARPVDIHLDAFRKLGVSVRTDGADIECTADSLRPADIVLRFPSVGATENIMILASSIEGTTRIYGAACEPEIEDLQTLLCRMGARINGAGTPVITVTGTHSFKDAEHRIMPDRIDAATFIAAVGCTGGETELFDVNAHHISPFIALMRQCGMGIYINRSGTVTAVKNKRLCGGIFARTMPYPGFATDMQSLLTAALSLSDGVSIVQENIFENRFCMCKALAKMGADIRVYGKTASIRGVRQLTGTDADACDLRSGAALAAAMLAADGVSHLGGIEFIDRGYEDFIPRLARLGAKTERIELS